MSATPAPDALPPPPQPIARTFVFRDHASLWFSLGVGLLVIQVGGYLASEVGVRAALAATLLGSIIGAALLAWVAKLGCDSGLSSAGLMQRTFGKRFARLPVLLNVVQLIGWTTFELVIMRDGTLTVIRRVSAGQTFTGLPIFLAATLLWSLLLLALLAGPMVTLVRRLVNRIGLPLVIASLLWLSWQLAVRLGGANTLALLDRPGSGNASMFSALDLVIAMPVSWLPLVADYARHGVRGGHGPGSAFSGTWLGYLLANIWCYGLGALMIGVNPPGTDLLTALLLSQGGLLALGFILVDELDNAYGDVYSASVSASSVWPRWNLRRWSLGFGLLCPLLALLLPMHSLEPFLSILSSVFVPLYGVILGRLGTGGLTHDRDVAIEPTASALWIAGVVLYQALTWQAPQFGATLPTLAFTFALAWLTRYRPARVRDRPF